MDCISIGEDRHHPSGSYLHTDRFTMGQNLAIIWSTIPLADDDGDFPSRIQNWFNEVRKYAWGAQWSEATGHYSQVNRTDCITVDQHK